MGKVNKCVDKQVKMAIYSFAYFPLSHFGGVAMEKKIKKGKKRTAVKTVTSQMKKTPQGNVVLAQKGQKDFRSDFMSKLTTRRRELEETLTQLVNSQKEYDSTSTAGDYIDHLDIAQREISSSSLYSLIERKNRELRKIEQLIARLLKDEEFGLCEECGKPIRHERLMIMPDATLCVSCQRDLERWSAGASIQQKRRARWIGKDDDLWNDQNDLDEEDELLIDMHGAKLSASDGEEFDPESPLDNSL